jgi:Tryptophan halogenase.
MNNNNPIQHLIIAGRGFTPVFTALFLQKKWGALAPRITLLQCGENQDPPILSCASSIKGVHKELGVAEIDFVKKTQASFHLGTLCHFPDRPEFFMSEAPYGVSIHAVRFQHWFIRYRQAGHSAQFDDFCINAQLAKRSRFAPPSPKPESVYSQVCYGYKLLSENYARYLTGHLGPHISVIQDEIANVETDSDGIKSIQLKNSAAVTADLYIDCTSDHKLKRFMSNGIRSSTAEHSWSVGETQKGRVGPPHNSLFAANDALTFVTELHGKIYRQTIPCNSVPSDWLRDPEPWQKNCLSLGAAISDRPSLLIDPVHLVASSLYRLYNSWPTGGDFRTPAQTYNSSFYDEWNRIADSDSLHVWAACGRDDKYLTEAAKHRLRVFASDGRIPPYENETLMEDQWAALFFAFGIMPDVADPLTVEADDAWVIAQLDKLKSTLQAAAQHAPELEQFYRSEVDIR